MKELKQIEAKIEYLNQPYCLDHQEAENLLNKIISWQKDPENDCLRARGDFRWQKAIELQNRIEKLLQPF